MAAILFAKFVSPRIDQWRMARVKAYEERTGKTPRGVNDFILGLIVCLALAALAEYIGLAAIIG